VARYYFHIHDGEKATVDETGLELEADHAAQQEAVRTLPEIARDVLPDGTQRNFVVTVRKDSRPILRATLLLTVERFDGKIPPLT